MTPEHPDAFSQEIDYFAEIVDSAALATTPITMLTAEAADMTLEDAYDIQRRSMRRRLGRGEELVGMKMGLTSKAKMQQVGVHNPIYGHLTDTMIATDGARLDADQFIHPRIEPEICFRLGRDLHGPTTPGQAAEAVDGVFAALEVIDSRYRDFEFTIIDVVADNASASKIVVGNRGVAIDDLARTNRELANLGMVLEHNGQVAHTGSSAAIYDHPLNALAELANLLAERDECLRAGQWVMAGAATAAVDVVAGDHVRAEVDGLGSVSVSIESPRK